MARLLAKRLGLRHHSIGDLMGTIARRRVVSLMELSREAESDKSIDRELDETQKELGKKEDGFVIDSRLGFHFIPNSIKILLKTDEKVAAGRIFQDFREDEKENTTLEKTLENIRKRKRSEDLRYRKYYGLDCRDRKHYDFVLDATNLTVEETVDKILKFLKKKGKYN